MLETVAFSVAMKKAHPKLKDIADLVIGTNTDNYISNFLDTIIKI